MTGALRSRLPLGLAAARDGEFDVVGCGAGRDSVVGDRADLVGPDCERVSRSGT